MDGYTVLYGALIFFGCFYLCNMVRHNFNKNRTSKRMKDLILKINPYDNLPIGRKFIDKKNKHVRNF